MKIHIYKCIWLLRCRWIEVPLSADSQISTNWMLQGLLHCATFNWHSDPSRAWLWPLHGPHCQLLLALGVCPDASSSVYLDTACGASWTRLAELVSSPFPCFCVRLFVIPSAVSHFKHSPLWSVKLFLGLSASYSPLSDEDDDVALLSVEMEPGEISISTCSGWKGNESQAVKRGSSGTTKIHSLCLDQALVTQTGTRLFCPCQWRQLCPLQGCSTWVWSAPNSSGLWST